MNNVRAVGARVGRGGGWHCPHILTDRLTLGGTLGPIIPTKIIFRPTALDDVDCTSLPQKNDCSLLFQVWTKKVAFQSEILETDVLALNSWISIVFAL